MAERAPKLKHASSPLTKRHARWLDASMFGDAPRSHWRVRGLHGDVWLVLAGVVGVTVERPIAGHVAARRVREWFPDRLSAGLARAQLRAISEALGGEVGPADTHARVALALRDGRLVATPAAPHVASPRVRRFEDAETPPDLFAPTLPVEAEPAPSEPVETPTFPEDLDAAAVATAQREAARTGKAFCEVCLRSRLAKARRQSAARLVQAPPEALPPGALPDTPSVGPGAPGAPPEPGTFPEDLDAAAIAAAQREAAQTGKPFCEVCLRKRLARDRARRPRVAAPQSTFTPPGASADAPPPTGRAPATPSATDMSGRTFPPDVDAAALAEVQRKAAAAGVPFCEICMQRALARARSQPQRGPS